MTFLNKVFVKVQVSERLRFEEVPSKMRASRLAVDQFRDDFVRGFAVGYRR